MADSLLVTVLALARMPQAELARRADLSTKHVNQLCKGLVPMSIDVALRLEEQLGIAAELWMHADTTARLAAARQAARAESDACRLVELPSGPIRVRGGAEPTAEDQRALTALVEAATRQYEAEGPHVLDFICPACQAKPGQLCRRESNPQFGRAPHPERTALTQPTTEECTDEPS